MVADLLTLLACMGGKKNNVQLRYKKQMNSKKYKQLRKTQNLTLPITKLKGVGPKRAALLASKGLYTILDLLVLTPIRYEDRTRVIPIRSAEEGAPSLVKGKVLYGREEKFYHSRKSLFRITIEDDEDSLDLIWFHYKQPHLARFAQKDLELLIYGSPRFNKGHKQMIHPDISVFDKDGEEKTLGFHPVYPSIERVTGNFIKNLIRTSLESYLETIIDPIPEKIIKKLGHPNLFQALSNVHFPSKDSSIEKLNTFSSPHHKRLIFDQFFLIMLAIAYKKRKREMARVPVQTAPKDLLSNIRKFFHFELTSHQLAAVEDVVKDLGQGRPMNRLLMGDVGCGKTVIAVLAIYINLQNKKQAAIMAPTQILAEQHFQYFSEFSETMGFRPVLFTGELPKRDRRSLYEDIANGFYNVVIGTHVILQKELKFSDLGLVVIDEQHRFGVRQRALIEKKGRTPHLLVMTATPIPRTLAITAYGDLDISIINEYPDNHYTVKTHLVASEEKRWVFESLKKRLQKGEQAFVICPIIEPTENNALKSAKEMEKGLKRIFSPSFRVGLMHGNLSQDERIRIMNDFRKGLIHLLVGTTVIEVGIHVPNATIMIIEHPERFGLAQLHQLRGRIGRGKKRGVCFLMKSENISKKAITRLGTLVDEYDGFKVAQKDLEFRGHGQLTGIRQSGVGELDFAELVREPDLLLDAKREAQNLISSDPELMRPEHSQLRLMIDSINGTLAD